MEKTPAVGARELGVDSNGAAPVEGAPAITKEGDEEENERVEGDGEEEGAKWVKHYSSMQSILIVGDGDFSFSLALAAAFGSGANLVATSLDTYDNLRGKYSKAEPNIMELKRLGATILHGVDVKRMKFHADLKNRRFDQIVFNFPHAGFKGHENQVHMIKLHKELVMGFFRNAIYLLRRYGEIHVSHKTGPPYDKWDLEHLASESSLVMTEKVCFQKADYPGYNQKKGDGAKCDQPFKLGPCCTFKFQIGDLKRKELDGNRAGSVSSVGGSDADPDKLATSPASTVRMPITLDPCIAAQRQHPGFPQNSAVMARGPCVHEQGTARPMLSIPGPLLKALSAPGWYQESADYSYLAREYQKSLQREYEIQRQVMPGANSLNYSAFLEHRLRESVQKQKWLHRMIGLYSRQ